MAISLAQSLVSQHNQRLSGQGAEKVMLGRFNLAGTALLSISVAWAQAPDELKPYIKEDAPVLVLNHVRVIDGSGAPALEDQRIEISGGRITAVRSAHTRSPLSRNAKVLDYRGRTVIPGLVGMHEHLYYTTPQRTGDLLPYFGEMIDSGPRLYLAAGVTSARTTGSVEPYTDLAL